MQEVVINCEYLSWYSRFTKFTNEQICSEILNNMKQHETYMKQTPHKKTKISLKLFFFSFSITNFSHEMFLNKVEIKIPTYFIFFLFNTQNVAKFCSRQFPVFVLRLLSFFLFSVNTYNMTTFS